MKISEHNEKVLGKFASMIIKRMEQMKSKQWNKGWIGRTYGCGPMNVEGRKYVGSNVFLLMMDCAMNDFKFPIYCTLKQANKLGAHVKKGSCSIPIIFWDYYITDSHGHLIKNEDYLILSSSDQHKCHKIPFLKSYNVFNVEQTTLDEVCPNKLTLLKSQFKVESFSDNNGMYDNFQLDTMLDNQSWLCPIQYKTPADGAYYSSSLDKVVVPMKSQFRVGNTPTEIYLDGQEFYSTLLHEMIHSTGIESRLNRNTGKRFGDKLYAREELIAELGAARVGQELGFDKRIIKNNAAYLDGWISSLKEEPKYILSLMSDVDKASRMILQQLAA